MRKKPTEMSREELEGYVARWAGKLSKFQQGSKNWRKVNRRIQRARRSCGLTSADGMM